MNREIYEDSRGRFVICQYDERNGNYVADMTAQSQRLTGCWQVSARTVDGISTSANVQRYASRASARRALRRMESQEDAS